MQKDGASSIYLADAIAAVVNFITRKNIRGTNYSISQGANEAGGGESKKAEAIFGIEGDRGNITLGMTWVNNLAVSNAEREETAARPASGGSSGTPQGRFSYSSLAMPNPAGGGEYRDDWVNDDDDGFLGKDYIKARQSNPLGAALSATYSAVKGGSHFIPNKDQTGNLDFTNVTNMTAVVYGNYAHLPASPEDRGKRPVGGFTPKDGNASALTGTQPGDFTTWHAGPNGWGFNYNPYNYVITPNERRSFFMRGNFEFNDDHSATFKMLYQNRRSDRLLAPTPLFWGFNADEGISASNAFNSLGVEFCSAGRSAYGEKESCVQGSHYYYTFEGNLKPIPTFYKEGDRFGTGANAEHKRYLYEATPTGELVRALIPVAANEDCDANGRPIGRNISVTRCSVYSQAYLDKDGNLEYVVGTQGSGDDATTHLYKATPDPNDPTKFIISGTPVDSDTDIYEAFINADVAKKDEDGNVIYSAGSYVLKPGYAIGSVRAGEFLEYGPAKLSHQDIETFHAQAGVIDGTGLMSEPLNGTYDAEWSWSQNQSFSRN